MAESDNQYRMIAALFVRLMGVFYFIAFASLAVQVEGLVGSHGIDPYAEKLARVQDYAGVAYYLRIPTLFWINVSDTALLGAAVLGAFFSVLIFVNRLQRLSLIASFILYLSLYHACQVFLNFQWDGLLLEAGFLAIFLTPRSRVVVLLFRWLLFRLRFMSGVSKIVSQDVSWSGLTALNYYFETQPLPTPLAWYFHHLPDWMLRFGTGATLFIEILVPFMMFLPRRWRFTAAWLTIIWQVLIILTSNHNWFNFLTIALCLFLFDDKAISRVLPAVLRARLETDTRPAPEVATAKRLGIMVLAGFILSSSAVHFWELVKMQPVSGLPGQLLDYSEAWRVVNKYHVFGSMKTERIELEISGSQDGKTWTPYVFKYKPGDPQQWPAVVIPHQPRLDWQMWFVALLPNQMRWFEGFLRALLNNSPTVTALLAQNPFPDTGPRYVRVDVYRYRFTTPEQRVQTGRWWQREALGPFGPLPGVRRE